MRRNVYPKILIAIIVILLSATTVKAQKPVVNATQKASSGSVQKTAAIKKVIQEPDTIQLTVSVIANAIRDVILKYYKSKMSPSGGLKITREYPLKVNLSLYREGKIKIFGENDSVSISGNAEMGETGEMVFAMTKKDGSNLGGSIDNLEWTSEEDMVYSINKGEINCAGYYLSKKSIPLYFEIGQIVFTDNEKLGTFSQGTIFVYNSSRYIYENSKWEIITQNRIQSERLIEVMRAKDCSNAKELVSAIESVNYRDRFGTSLLCYASLYDCMDVVKTLLVKRANVNLLSTTGITALIAASGNCNLELVKLLLDKGAMVDLKDTDGPTALLKASQKGCSEVVKLLLDKGAKVDLQDTDGSNALLIASQKGHIEVVKLLLDKGAKVDLKDYDGSTALLNASYMNHLEVVKLLLNKGAKVDLRDTGGYTALLISAQKGNTEVVKLLLDKGANPNLKTNDGKTALDIAKNIDIKNLLNAHMKK